MDSGDAITRLLSEAESAHGVYEARVLNGIYDEDWPQWYAQYAVDHGLGDHLGHLVTADELARFLSSAFAEFNAQQPGSADGWADYTAGRIAREL